jgi:hypothetical protein
MSQLQVLAVQADLVRHPAIRRELSTVFEKCQPAPLEDVIHAIRCSAPRVLDVCGPVGEHLNAGSIAQVNALGQHQVSASGGARSHGEAGVEGPELPRLSSRHGTDALVSHNR